MAAVQLCLPYSTPTPRTRRRRRTHSQSRTRAEGEGGRAHLPLQLGHPPSPHLALAVERYGYAATLESPAESPAEALIVSSL